MNKGVVFTSNNARVVFGDNLPHDAIQNPDLSKVRGIPPHYWKKTADGIVEMTTEEKLIRDAHHAKYGVDNGHRRIHKKSAFHWEYLLIYASGIGTSLIIQFLTRHAG